jgi:hypothetical protein
LNNRLTAVNLTFTFNSIELRLNGQENHLIRLTDRYFNLFFRSLLKAYGSFQLNLTSFENVNNQASNLTLAGVFDSSNHLVSSCLTDFKLSTRKSASIGNNFEYTYYDLIDQTRSVSYFQSEFFYDLSFEESCSYQNFYKHPGRRGEARLLGKEGNGCYLVSRIDAITSQKIDDFYDCESKCSASESNSCGFAFWSSYQDRREKDLVIQQPTLPPSCNESLEYACFNNASCVDTPRHSFACFCLGSYTGDR